MKFITSKKEKKLKTIKEKFESESFWFGSKEAYDKIDKDKTIIYLRNTLKDVFAIAGVD